MGAKFPVPVYDDHHLARCRTSFLAKNIWTCVRLPAGWRHEIPSSTVSRYGYVWFWAYERLRRNLYVQRESDVLSLRLDVGGGFGDTEDVRLGYRSMLLANGASRKGCPVFTLWPPLDDGV